MLTQIMMAEPVLQCFSGISVQNTVKPVLSSHPREPKKWLLKIGDLLIKVHLHYIFALRIPRKMVGGGR